MATKKDFKGNNPALAYISSPAPSEEPQGSSKPPAGYKLNPEYVETKTRRVQLLLQPSVADGLKAIARAKGLSMNEAASEAIKRYIETEG